MYFSIVTVVLNDLLHLKTTVKSVLAQKYTDYEYIIMDGMSDDGTQQFVEELQKEHSQIIYHRQKDNGIYFAMNNAIKHAKGEYTVFLNAGDVFFDEDILKYVYEENDKCVDFFYGYSLISSGMKKGGRAGKKITPLLFRIGGWISHQATFEKTVLLKKHPFDTKYIIQADQEQIMYWLKKNATFYYVDKPLCLFDGCGMSSSRKSEVLSLRERASILKKYYRLSYYPFCLLAHLKIKFQYSDIKE